jgi:predicted RNA-binding Zn-ribbon protein involved in translation (DUF1610 family)
MKSTDMKFGYCYKCGQTSWPPESGDQSVCAACGDRLVPRGELSRTLRKVFDFQSWSNGLSVRGLSGLSPGGAAEELGCHRTMIDKLADMGVLEKSVYNKDGFFVVEISARSIDKAIENKKLTGKWTGTGEVKPRGLWKRLAKNFCL